MKTERITFNNTKGLTLAARLDIPEQDKPLAFAVFAHCFTCNKNLTAVTNIGRTLMANGIAVLRFDFTGLGQSDGEFEDTNFSSNVEDLVAAARFLEQHHEAPKLLIGHSLGGAAVVFAAQDIPSVRAIATIGAPSDPKHVSRLLLSEIDEIEKSGKATVIIGGREFTIQKQFLDDINGKKMSQALYNFEGALLVMHSPQDQTVGIDNAAQIYKYAQHSKSFISLDGADHLLSRKEDSHYVGRMIAHWAVRYLNPLP